jgi:hypothetical protein
MMTDHNNRIADMASTGSAASEHLVIHWLYCTESKIIKTIVLSSASIIHEPRKEDDGYSVLGRH